MPESGDAVYDAILDAVYGAKNKLTLQSFTESVMVDEGWLDTLDEYLPSIEKICKKPKSFIVDEKAIVPVEKARRVTSETIRHLSSHTSYIRGIDDDGSVIPSKLLTSFMEEDLGIYENRFVFTLINRLAIFVDKQILALKGLSASETVALEHRSEYAAGGYKFKYELKTTIAKPFPQSNYDMTRVENLVFRLNLIKSSQFYLALKKFKVVRPPVMRTNILKMDVDYNNAYKCWLFIAACDKLGYTTDASSRNLPGDDIFEEVLRLTNAFYSRAFLYHLEDIGQDIAELPYRRKTKKKFRIVEKNLFVPTVLRSRETTAEEDAAKYYAEVFRSQALGQLADPDETAAEKKQEDEEKEQPDYLDKRKVFIDEREKNIPFDNLYSQIANINESLYYDALKIDLNKPERLPGETSDAFRRREAQTNIHNAKWLRDLALRKEHEAEMLQKLSDKCFNKYESLLNAGNFTPKKKAAAKAAPAKAASAKTTPAKAAPAKKPPVTETVAVNEEEKK